MVSNAFDIFIHINVAGVDKLFTFLKLTDEDLIEEFGEILKEFKRMLKMLNVSFDIEADRV